MLSNLLQSCGKPNRIKRIRLVQQRLFANKKKVTDSSKLTSDLTKSEPSNILPSKSLFTNGKFESDFGQGPSHAHKSGLSFASLFKKECDPRDIGEILEAVEYLLKASEGDLEKIKRFYVTVLVLAIHAPSLNPKVKASMRKYFQLSDENDWRENPFLRLCEAYSQVQNDPLAKFSVAFRVDKPKLRAILTLKNYLDEAVRAGVPELEPWDLMAAKSRVNSLWSLMNSSKVANLKQSSLKVIRLGVETCVNQDLLAKSMNSEVSLAPKLESKASLMSLLEHFAYKAAPLNQNSKPFDPERPHFDYPTNLNLPEIVKDFTQGEAAKHLPMFNSHPYLKLFFESDFKANEYEKKASYVAEKKDLLERKPLRVEAIINIQRALALRSRAREVFPQSLSILESFLDSDEKMLSSEALETLDSEYSDFVELCRDPNHFLKQDGLRSGLGEKTFGRLGHFQEFTKTNQEELTLDAKKDNQLMLREFLGKAQQKDNSGYEKKIQAYFQTKRKDVSKPGKHFECATQEEFEKEWAIYFNQRASEAEQRDFCADSEAFIRSLSAFLTNTATQLSFQELSSFESAANNFCQLHPVSSKRDLQGLQRVLYGKLIENLKSEQLTENKDHLSMVNRLATRLIESGNYKTVAENLRKLEETAPLRSSLELESFLAARIQDELSNLDSDSDTSVLLTLLKHYSQTLLSLLRNNLHLTFQHVGAESCTDLTGEIMETRPSYLECLSSKQILIGLSSWLDSDTSGKHQQIRVDLQVFTENLISSLSTFFKVHPFFAVQSGVKITEQAGESQWSSVLSKVDFQEKEERLRTQGLVLERVRTMDSLLPGNCLLFHFLYSCSPQVWNPDRVFLLDFENNLQPLLETVQNLPEEYLLTLENWLVVFTDTSLSLEDMLASFSECEALASASESLLPAGSTFLPSSFRCAVLKWHSQKVLWELSSTSLLQDTDFPEDWPALKSPLLKFLTRFDLQAASVASEQSLALTHSFAKTCASATKNSSFLRFPEDQLTSLTAAFFEEHALKGSHSLGSTLLAVFSFVTGRTDFFFQCFEDPVLLGRNPLVVKKQNYYFLLTLLKARPDAAQALQIQKHFAPELAICFPKDQLVLDLAFTSISDPAKCSEIFQKELMNPLYVNILKQKMTSFYRMYLEGLQQPEASEEGHMTIEEAPQRKNLFDGSLDREDISRNQFIHNSRKDSDGNPIANGNQIVTGFDPKSRPTDDKFTALGDIDMRSGAVVDFESKLTDNDALQIQEKVEQLFEDAESLDWKELFEKDSSGSLHNAIQQKYYLTDQEFWKRYKKYVDSEIDQVVQIKRDFRRILWRFRELNKGRKDKGDFLVNIQKVVEDFYASEPRHNVSTLRSFFEEKQNMDNIINQISGKETFQDAPSLDELAREVGEFNTVAALTSPKVFGGGREKRLIGDLVKQQPIGEKEALEIAGQIGGIGDRNMLKMVWDSDQGEFGTQLDLTEREKELILEVKAKFMEMVNRKEEMDLAGRTARKVLSVKLMQAELFEVTSGQDFARRLSEINEAEGTQVSLTDDLVRELFQEVKAIVYSTFSSDLKQFATKWGLLVSEEEPLIPQLVAGIRARLGFSRAGQHQLDAKANLLQQRMEDLGSDVMYEGEWQTKVISFELLSSFEKFLFSMNSAFGEEEILKSMLSKSQGKEVGSKIKLKVETLLEKGRMQEAPAKKVEDELRRALEDESEDLVEESVYTQYKHRMEAALDQQMNEQEKRDRKLFVFNFQVNQMKNDKSISKLRAMRGSVEADLKTELEGLKRGDQNPEADARKNELEKILSLSSESALGEDVLLELQGLGSLTEKFVEKEWYQTYKKWLEERKTAAKKMTNSMDPSLKAADELNKIQNMGLKRYLVEEIGLAQYLGEEGYVRVQRILGGEMSDSEMSDAVLTELVGEEEEKEKVDEVLEGVVEDGEAVQPKQNLGRELKLLSMKMKLIEEEVKDLESMEQTRYFNKVIKVDRQIQGIRDGGREPTKQEVLRLIADWDLEERHTRLQVSQMAESSENVFQFYFTQKQRKYVEAKARVLIDYLLRFDPEFRKVYLKSRSMEKMGATLEQEMTFEVSNEDFLADLNVLDLNPSTFVMDRKSVMIRAIERGIHHEFPDDFLAQSKSLVGQDVQAFVTDSVLSLTEEVERRLISDVIDEKQQRRTRKVEELEYIGQVKQWIDRTAETRVEELFPLGQAENKGALTEQPLILGTLVEDRGDLTREELVQVLRNPSLENKAKVTDLILANLQRVNNLEDNDPHLLSLIETMFEGKHASLHNPSPSSDGLLKAAEALEKAEVKKPQEMPEVDWTNPLSPPPLSEFTQRSTEEINECLLNLLTEHDLSELGITKSFVSALKEFNEVQSEKRSAKQQEKEKYQALVEGKEFQEVKQLQTGSSGYFPTNMSLLDRRSQSHMLAEQLAINEVNVKEQRMTDGNPVAYLKGKLTKQRVYRVLPKGKIISREEFVLSNNQVFNIYEEPEDLKEMKSITFK